MTEKILVCNPAGIGDAIMATAVLPPLKKAFPNASIGFLTSSQARPVVENHLLVDWVHVYDHPRLNRQKIPLRERKRWGKKTWHQAFFEIKEKKYTLAFDLYSLFRNHSASLLALTEIPVRIGFWPSRSHLFYNHTVFIKNIQQSPLLSHRTLLRGCGIEVPEDFKPHLVYKGERQEKKLPFEKYIAIHMGSAMDKKKWNANAWLELTLKLQKEGIPLVFLGRGEKERDEIKKVTEKLTNFLDLCDLLSWRELLSVIKQATLLIGLDSMSGHIASALETPAILIYGGTTPIEKWRPFNPCCHIISPSQTLFNQKGLAPKSAIHTITAEEVFEKIYRVCPLSFKL